MNVFIFSFFFSRSMALYRFILFMFLNKQKYSRFLLFIVFYTRTLPLLFITPLLYTEIHVYNMMLSNATLSGDRRRAYFFFIFMYSLANSFC
ncbi:hypothetical protein BDC45DRAFT_524875 [Circinella umbellata]|nr:hypothetical protein BDC45DRAFT_524875 [Circinella umbellata]